MLCMSQNVAILTTSRSDYYQIKSLLRHLQESKSLSLHLFVTGSHLSAKFGNTEHDIVADGFSLYERLPILVDDDSALGCAVSAGIAVKEIAEALHRNDTDIFILMGDRYESVGAALAATCMGIPIAHIHGGERTDGAIDDVCRHAITKLSSLHFVSTDVYRARVIQMGETPEHVFTVGAPLTDEIRTTPLLTKQELTDNIGLRLDPPVALIAYHPTTYEQVDDSHICHLILKSVAEHCNTIIITAPNHDSGNEAIIDTMKDFTQAHENANLFANLGSQKFFSVMSFADLMIGNSSSGIHEAVSFHLPVVNIGSRQASRLRPRNVIDCKPHEDSIRKAISTALSYEFQKGLTELKNPYGNGNTGERIVRILERFSPFKSALKKSFCDSPNVKTAVEEWSQLYG